MATGYEIELSDGLLLQFIPSENAKECAIGYGDLMLELDADSGSFHASAARGKVLASIATVVRFAKKDIPFDGKKQQPEGPSPDFDILRTCHTCNGRRCCVTNGCLNCGCGWICD
jgi:hypothetical protein